VPEPHPAHRLAGYENVETYHPTFAYEFIWNLLNMGLLLFLGKKYAGKLKDGDLFLVYLMFYAVGRFGLEFVRLDYSPIAGVNINQYMMAAVFICSLAFFLVRHLVKKPATAEETE